MIRSMRFRDLFCAISVLAAPALSTAAAVTPYSGPLFDAHCHVVQPEGGRGRGRVPAILPPALFDRLRTTGVTGVFFFAPADVSERVKRVGGDFVAPFASVATDPLKQELHLSATTAVAVEEQLKAGMKGVGEIPMRHRPTFHGSYRGYPADGPFALAIYAVAAKYGVPVNVHVEHEFKDELEHALARSPKTTIIWAHVGDGPASDAKKLMRRYPNLLADISTRNPYMKLGRPQMMQRLTNEDGTIQGEWKKLFEEYPDRFLYGLDLNTLERVEALDRITTYYRSVLGQLSAETSEKIAYRNARHLLEPHITGRP